MSLESSLLTLIHPVRSRVVAYYLGRLQLMLAGLLLVPAIVALIAGELAQSLPYAGIALALALTAHLLHRPPVNRDLRLNEGLVIAALTYLISSLALGLAFMDAGICPLDAWFEAVSALTTTGLSTAGSLHGQSFTFLFARAWGQWFGGLGIVFFTLLLIGPGIASKRLLDRGVEQSDLAGSSLAHVRRVLAVYLSLTLAGIVLVWPLMGGSAALLHVLTGISTGGFSPHDDSLASYGALAQTVLLLVSWAGAIPLPLWFRSWQLRSPRELLRDAEVRTLALLSLLGALAFSAALALADGLPWREALHHGPLVILSAQSGTGFTTIDLRGLSAIGLLVLVIAMFIGGGIASTAGGIKVWRLLVLLRLGQLLLLRPSLGSHVVAEPTINRRRPDEEELQQALMMIVLFVALCFASWLPFLASGLPPIESLFEVVSAVATVGLSAGIATPELHPGLKTVLIADMLLGRVELVALLLLFWPGTWMRRSNGR